MGGKGARLERFSPVNSGQGDVNLDKARRLLSPVKQR